MANHCLRKSGGQMNEDLDMNNRFIRGLPTHVQTDYQGDEVITWQQAVQLVYTNTRDLDTGEHLENVGVKLN